jgi:hypothetical protein
MSLHNHSPSWWRRLLGRGYAVYHAVPKKNRRDAPLPCSGVAFYRRGRGPVPTLEIPDTCLTCGRVLQVKHLEFGEVLRGDATFITPGNAGQLPPPRKHQDPPRRPRHFSAKGAPITEVSGE